MLGGFSIGGDNVDRRKQLDNIFKNVSDEEKQLVDRLIDEVIFLEQQMNELKELPFISVHPDKPNLQKVTPAAKLYKECSQSYMNAVRILLSILHKVETSAQDELLNMLEEFS